MSITILIITILMITIIPSHRERGQRRVALDGPAERHQGRGGEAAGEASGQKIAQQKSTPRKSSWIFSGIFRWIFSGIFSGFSVKPWLRTNGVSTNDGASAKVMKFDRLGEKVRPGNFGKIKVG